MFLCIFINGAIHEQESLNDAKDSTR